MKLIACRDCGHMLDPILRGCPRWALNLEAERMIDRIAWRVMIAVLLVLLVVASGILFYFRH